MKLYLKTIGYSFLLILILILILTISHYFNLINHNLLDIGKLLILIITLLLGAFQIGRQTNQKGWLAGLKFGMTIIFLFLFFNIIFKFNFSWKLILYYTLILISSTLGSMFGISFKKKKT
ncbi:MAG: TIGR04086 family membrane protein [Bacilli bacterium]|jgi:putative membrane protein (TIGR04086 family)